MQSHLLLSRLRIVFLISLALSVQQNKLFLSHFISFLKKTHINHIFIIQPKPVVTGHIIAALEKGRFPWNKPWTDIRSSAYSRVTGKPYSLLNQLLLVKLRKTSRCRRHSEEG